MMIVVTHPCFLGVLQVQKLKLDTEAAMLQVNLLYFGLSDVVSTYPIS